MQEQLYFNIQHKQRQLSLVTDELYLTNPLGNKFSITKFGSKLRDRQQMTTVDKEAARLNVFNGHSCPRMVCVFAFFCFLSVPDFVMSFAYLDIFKKKKKLHLKPLKNANGFSPSQVRNFITYCLTKPNMFFFTGKGLRDPYRLSYPYIYSSKNISKKSAQFRYIHTQRSLGRNFSLYSIYVHKRLKIHYKSSRITQIPR